MNSDPTGGMKAATQIPPSGVYRFGTCVLDVARRELRRDGELVPLQPKVFELLAYLIEHRDRAVDKAEIQDAVWPRVIVTETSLTQAIRKARRAVADDANTQTVIRTVHGHGYRFVAPLAEPSPADPEPRVEAPPLPATPTEPVVEPAAPTPRTATSARFWRFRHPVAWIAALGIAVLIAFLWVLRPTPLSASGLRIAVLPVVNETDDPDLQWTRLGLMSLASSLLGAADLAVVADADVVRIAAGAGATGEADDSPLYQRLRQAYGATHVLATRLEREAGLMRLGFTLTDSSGDAYTEMMVGEEPLALVRAAVQRVLQSLGRGGAAPMERRLISDDPFVNEAYARGRSLALEGRCGDAQALFRAVINQGPELFEPPFEYAACARVLGSWQEAEDLYVQLIDLESELEGRPLARALNGLGVVYDRTGRLDLAGQTYGRAAAVARDVGDPVLSGDIAVNLGILAENRGEFAIAREHLGRAMSHYRQAGLEVIPGSLYNTMANVAMDEGALDEAEALFAKSIQSFQAVGDRRREALAINNSGFLRAQQGRYEEAIPLHRRSGEIREEVGDRVGLAWVNNLLAVSLIELGRLEEAEAATQSSLDIARDTRERLLEATSQARLGEIALQRSALDTATEHFEAARTIFADIDDALRVELVDLKLARIALLDGDSEAARVTAQNVLERAREQKLNDPEIESLQLLGDVAAARADPVAFENYYRDGIERAREIGNTGKLTELRIKLAHAYLDRDDLEQAEAVVGLLADVPDSAALLRLKAEYAYRRGERAEASALMERARALAGERWSDRDADRLAMYQR